MNVYSYRAAWAARELGATGSELLVALALANYADRNGEAWPGRRRLSEVTGASEATVKRAIGRLRALGVIEVLSRGTGPGLLRRYRLRLKPSDHSAQVVPFPAQAGVTGDPRSAPERGSCGAQTRVMENTQYPYENYKTRARAAGAPIAAGDDAKARRLAESLKRGGEGALVLPNWKTPEVATLAIERYGADAAMLTRHGCEVPSDLRHGAPSVDGRSHEDASGDAGDGFAGWPAQGGKRMCNEGEEL